MTDSFAYEKHRTYSAVIEADQALRDAQEALRAAVKEARREGNSWQDIGDALDVSKQAAQQRFGE